MLTAFRKKVNSGFTLVELLVTISIFVILTGVVLFSQTKFNSTILLTNLAYDTALTIRQAQNYGINIKEFNLGGVSKFVPYGIHFDLTKNKSFILFADLNFDLNTKELSPFSSDDASRCLNNEGCVNIYNIKRNNYISTLCVVSSGSELCEPVEKLDILFQRPNPDAVIFGDGENNKSRAIITLKGVDGSDRQVVVQANGLIEIVH